MSDNNSTKKGTIIYNDLLDKCKRMDDAQFGRTMRLILQYAEEQQLPNLDDEDPFIATIFEFVRPSIDSDRAKWEARREVNRKNGKKGGRPKATETETNPQETHENPSHKNESEINPKEPDNGYRITDIGERKEDRDIPPAGGEPCGSHQSIFDHYLELGLIKHKALTPEMKNSIDKARRRGKYSWDDLKKLLDRHAYVVKLTAGNGDFAVKPRGINEFFGQGIHGGTALICSEYADEGAKWQMYKDGNPHKPRSDTPKRESFERPVNSGGVTHYVDPFADEYSHLAEDLFADEKTAAGGSSP